VGNLFGSSVALSYDGDTALVGAPQRNTYRGAAEVFTFGNGAWSPPTELSLGPGYTTTELGTSVALSSDGHTVLVGAPGGSQVNFGPLAGSAAVYGLTNGSWTQTALLTLGAAAVHGDGLGESVALDDTGDVALVGAWGRAVNGQPYAGAAEVFTLSGGTWSAPVELSLGTLAQPDDQLGASVALSADGDTAVAGAPLRTVDGQQESGAAEVFELTGGSWSVPTELSLAADGTAIEGFARDVAISGDGSTIIASASLQSVEGQIDAGAGQLYTRDANGWQGPTQLDLSAGDMGLDSLGASVALAYDGQTVLLGAPGRTVGGHEGGGAGEIFSRLPASATDISVHSGTNPSVYGDTLTFTASVQSAGTLTGSVTFWEGLPFRPSSTLLGTAAVDGGEATLATSNVQAGDQSVYAEYEGDSNNAPSRGVIEQTVTPAPLMISATDQSIPYGSPASGFGFQANGFVDGDTISSLGSQPACQSTAAAASPVGAYQITCSGAVDPNYTISYVVGTLHITPAELTITLDSQSVSHGHPPAPYTWSADFVAADTAESLTKAPACVSTVQLDTNGNVVSPAGNYPITCAGAVDPNYTFRYQTSWLNVALQPTIPAYTGRLPFRAGTRARLSATLHSDKGGPVPGRVIAFKLGKGKSAVTCSARTTPAGQASCTVKVALKRGTYPLSAQFSGDKVGREYDFARSGIVRTVKVR
jgi:hypothetical protein